jgi:hypothetical protein
MVIVVENKGNNMDKKDEEKLKNSLLLGLPVSDDEIEPVSSLWGVVAVVVCVALVALIFWKS